MSPTEGFSDPVFAARTRDVIERMMIAAVDKVRPPYRYGEVTQIDRDQRTCKVLYPEADEAVTVKMGSVQPSAIGQVVRVDGRPGDRWIVDVIGRAVATGIPAADLPVVTGLNVTAGVYQVAAQWNTIPEVDQYEVAFADNAAFTALPRSFTTTSTAFILPNLNKDDVVFARVRALSSHGAGPWSSVHSATVLGVPSPHEFSDGQPPDASPQPVVRPAIGFVMAEWVAQPNAGIVTYEVHVSLSSGFTPSSSTLLGETDGTFYMVSSLADGSPLPYGQNVFVRLVAKDADGAASPGAQGFAAPRRVDTGDIGEVAGDAIGDGQIPAESPNAPTITAGVGYLLAAWAHSPNADPLTYEVHVSDDSGFTPSANTLIGTTPSNFAFIRNLGPGAGGGPLVYGTTYYVKIRATDNDGPAVNAGTQGSGTPLKVGTVDITEGAITAESAILADLAVDSAKIADAAITNAKIASLAVSSANIQDLAVGTAKIADAAIVTAKIGDAQITNAKIDTLSASKITAGTITAQAIVLSGGTALIRSSNFVSGSSGWQIDGNGQVEFAGGVFRGTLAAQSDNFRIEVAPLDGLGNSVPQVKFTRLSNMHSVSLGVEVYGSDTHLVTNGFFSVKDGLVVRSGASVYGSLTMLNGGILMQGGNILVNGAYYLAGNGTALRVSGNLEVSSWVTCVGLTQTSTIRIKKNIRNVEGSLRREVGSALASLRPALYDLRDEAIGEGTVPGTGSTVDVLGLIAEEVDASAPQFATRDGDGRAVGVNYSAITTALVAVVQDLSARIKTLEAASVKTIGT